MTCPGYFMNDLLRPWIWPSFSPSSRLYGPEAVRPRVFLPQAPRDYAPRAKHGTGGEGRTSSPCDVPFRYGSGPPSCGWPAARPPRLSEQARDGGAGTPIFTVSRQQFMKHPG
jgi:hypothetical protein